MKIFTIAIAMLALAFTGMPAMSEPVFHGELRIDAPWSRATPPGAKVGAGYITITNTGAQPDTLTGASADIAGMVQIHASSMEGGVMRMREMGEGLVIAPGETAVLKPGGDHIMFMMLTGPIEKGGTFPVTLSFERAGDVVVDFPVAALGAKSPPAN